MSDVPLYGVLAEFAGPEELVRAAQELDAKGYTQVESFTPFAVEGISEVHRFRPTSVALIFLVAALLSASAGYLMQYDASVISYPQNIGGRPLHSWPSFIPITFEMGVLGGVLGGVFGMIVLNGLPRYSHPLFNVERFRAASSDAFFLCIKATDPRFHRNATSDVLQEVGAMEITEVPS